MKLPASVEEIAQVIGRHKALFLVGKLPRCAAIDRRYKAARSTHVILYVPKRMRADHELVRILGIEDAEKIRRAFGGEILQPASCAEVYRRFRDDSLRRMHSQGYSVETLAEWFGISGRHVRNVVAVGEIPQEAALQ